MKSLKKDFINGAVKHGGQDKKVVSDLFNRMGEFARYSFNKCLTGNTLLSLPEGKKFSIDYVRERLSKGNNVLIGSYDHENKKVFYDNCLEVIDAGEQDVVVITLSNRSCETCTLEHRFMCIDGQMRTVEDIVNNDYRLLDPVNGEGVSVEDIVFHGVQQVYNLRMESDTHNYILGSGLVSANSHAVAYAYITYQTAWLKANYSAEYLAAAISCEPDTEQQSAYMADARSNNVDILPPDVNSSAKDFYVNPDGQILFGFNSIKGLGEKAIVAMISLQPFSSFGDFIIRTYHAQGVNRKVIDSLIYSGACDSFGYKRSCLIVSFEKFLLEYVSALKKSEYSRIMSLDFCKNEESFFEVEGIEEFPMLKILEYEKELLGLHVSGNPFDIISEMVKEDLVPGSDYARIKNGVVNTLVFVDRIKKIVTKKGDDMAFIDCSDRDGVSLSLVVFPNTYASVGRLVRKGSYTLVRVQIKTEERGKGFFLLDVKDLTIAIDKAAEKVEESNSIKHIDLVMERCSAVRIKSLKNKINLYLSEDDIPTGYTASTVVLVNGIEFKIATFNLKVINLSLIRDFSRFSGLIVRRG